MADELTTIRIFQLANFDDDEKDTIRGFLIGDKENVEIEWNEWGYDEDGGEGSIQPQYKTDPATVMFFVDREGLENNSYLVADGRCIRQPWYCDLVLTHYGFTNTEGWEFSVEAVDIFENHAVPWCRFEALGKWDILDVWNSYETNEEYSILDSINSEGDVIYVSYSVDDEEDVVAQLNALGLGEAVEEADEGGENEEEAEEAVDEEQEDNENEEEEEEEEDDAGEDAEEDAGEDAEEEPEEEED